VKGKNCQGHRDEVEKKKVKGVKRLVGPRSGDQGWEAPVFEKNLGAGKKRRRRTSRGGKQGERGSQVPCTEAKPADKKQQR